MKFGKRNWIMSIAILVAALLVAFLIRSCNRHTEIRDDVFSQSAASAAAAGCANSRELFVRLERAAQIDDSKIGLRAAVAKETLAPIEKLFLESGVKIRFYVPRDKRFSAREPLAWADLHAHLHAAQMNARRDRDRPIGCEREVSVLIAPESTLGYGLMFDYGNSSADGIPRQGAAIFMGPITRAFPSSDLEVFRRVLAHELLHVLNVHHQDWCCRPDSVAFGTAKSIEGGNWRLTPATQGWATGMATKDHIALSPMEFVMPGPGSVPFNCVTKEHKQKHERDPVPDEVQVPMEPTADSGIRDCHTQVDQSGAAMATPFPVTANRFGASLTARLERRVVHIGEVFEIRLEITNWGDEKFFIPPNLMPESGGVVVLIEEPGGTTFTRFSPPAHFDAFDGELELAPRTSTVSHFTAFFGANGWTLKRPGRYRLQLVSNARIDDERIAIVSNVVEFAAVATDQPACASYQAAVQGKNGSLLSNELGISMYLDGTPYLGYANRFAERLIDEHPECALNGGLILARTQAALRASPTDASISAIARDLEEINPAAVPSRVLRETQKSSCRAALAVGDSTSQKQICSALDQLQTAPAPQDKDFNFPPQTIQGVIHFRPGSVVLDDDSLIDAQRLADYLAADEHRRLWLMGRADAKGSNEMNLWVSHERALAVRSLLLVSNAKAHQIVITACGEAGAAPEDSDDSVRARDRRVDVITEPALKLLHYVPSEIKSNPLVLLADTCGG